MNLHDWIDELCDVLDIEVDVDEALVHDLARDAAHHVDERAAAVSAFLLGYAAAQSGGDQEELERLAAAATELAVRWDEPAEDGDDELDVDPDADPFVGEVEPAEDADED